MAHQRRSTGNAAHSTHGLIRSQHARRRQGERNSNFFKSGKEENQAFERARRSWDFLLDISHRASESESQRAHRLHECAPLLFFAVCGGIRLAFAERSGGRSMPYPSAALKSSGERTAARKEPQTETDSTTPRGGFVCQSTAHSRCDRTSHPTSFRAVLN